MKQNGTLKGISEYSEHSPYFTEFYRLYARMRAPIEGRIPQIFMVTSAIASEGKTTISAYIALTAALSTKSNHLVMDTDLNRPTLHKKLGLEQVNGLTEILSDGLELQQAIQTTPYSGLHVISAGRNVARPFELLSFGRVENLFNQLRLFYDTIILDAPPILHVGDTLKLAEFVDGILLVVLSGRTNREIVKRAIELLDETGKPILGIVMNDMGEVLPYYYQHKYYSYHYGSSEVK